MGLWENNLAASLTYQDLGDCSLGSIPAITGLDEARDEKTKECGPVLPDKQKKQATVINFMKKVCGIVILTAAGVIAKIL